MEEKAPLRGDNCIATIKLLKWPTGWSGTLGNLNGRREVSHSQKKKNLQKITVKGVALKRLRTGYSGAVLTRNSDQSETSCLDINNFFSAGHLEDQKDTVNHIYYH